MRAGLRLNILFPPGAGSFSSGTCPVMPLITSLHASGEGVTLPKVPVHRGTRHCLLLLSLATLSQRTSQAPPQPRASLGAADAAPLVMAAGNLVSGAILEACAGPTPGPVAIHLLQF